MKKAFKYIFVIALMMALKCNNVNALTKVWSSVDGSPSRFDEPMDNDLYNYYPYGFVKVKDEVSDSVFPDSDSIDDYYFLFYYQGTSMNLYYTKLNKSINPAGDKIYFADYPQSGEYDGFIDYMRLDAANGNYANFMPILIEGKDGTVTDHYIDSQNYYEYLDDASNTQERVKAQNELIRVVSGNYKDYKSTLKVNYRIIDGFEDLTNEKVEVADGNNALDTLFTSIKEKASQEQKTGNKVADKNKTENKETSFTCDSMPRTIALIKQLYNLIRYLIPILIIGLSVVDLIKSTASGEEKVFKEVWNKFVKRLIVGVVILLLPVLIRFIINISDALSEYGIADNSLFCIFK